MSFRAGQGFSGEGKAEVSLAIVEITILLSFFNYFSDLRGWKFKNMI